MVPAYLHFYWTSWQFSLANRSARLQVAQAHSPVRPDKSRWIMDELANQWYQAGSLFIQAGFLIAAVWSVRAILKSVRASQEQMGALLRLTVGGTHSEQSTRGGVRATPYLLDGWPEATD